MVHCGNFSRHAALALSGYRSGMQISDEALNDLMAIYKEEFGEEIDRREATEMAHRLIALYTLLAKKLPKETSGTTPRCAESRDSCRTIGFQT